MLGSKAWTVAAMCSLFHTRLQRQVEEYVAWVNSHLKKRAGSPLIYDLRSMQDGVTLVSLVEVLSEFVCAATREHAL